MKPIDMQTTSEWIRQLIKEELAKLDEPTRMDVLTLVDRDKESGKSAASVDLHQIANWIQAKASDRIGFEEARGLRRHYDRSNRDPDEQTS